MSESLYSKFRKLWDPASIFMEAADGRLWRYGDLERITADLSRRLRGLGLRKGDRIVAQIERSPWSLFLYFASLRAGLVWVPLNPRASKAELSPIIAEVEPSILVGNAHLVEALRQLVRGTNVRVLTLDDDDGGNLLQLPMADVEPDAEVKGDDIAAILFTSGTTGRPKGAVMPHNHLIRKARILGRAFEWTQNDRLLHVMPLNHAHGLFMTIHCVVEAGASMILMPRFETRDVVERLPSVTVLSGVPTMYARMLTDPMLTEKSRDIRLFISASAPLPPDLLIKFRGLTGHTIVESWGTSETLTLTAQPLLGERRIGSVGQPLPEVDVRVVDETGRKLPTGEVGHLEVRGPTRFAGYWKSSELDHTLFRKDGFLRIGDLGFIDEDRYITIVGRSSDVIITGGYKVYPKEIEHVLEQHAEISKAAVFGLPHPEYGEAVSAAIEVVSGYEIEVDRILCELRGVLVGYKVPKAVFVVDSLPRTELGKIRRNDLIKSFRTHFEHKGALSVKVGP
jgi:malonyl-CoA/methylmalonyl-CoA synthetase